MKTNKINRNHCDGSLNISYLCHVALSDNTISILQSGIAPPLQENPSRSFFTDFTLQEDCAEAHLETPYFLVILFTILWLVVIDIHVFIIYIFYQHNSLYRNIFHMILHKAIGGDVVGLIHVS